MVAREGNWATKWAVALASPYVCILSRKRKPLVIGLIMNEMENRVRLQVGERQFSTTKDTLMGESAYFSALFSGRWSNQSDDGSYFIDSDPELFVDILRYLRSGNYPLFFDPAAGTYDYARYSALLGEAQYFGITQLENWIRNQRYLEAVKTRYSLDVLGPIKAEHLKGHSYSVTAAQRLEFSFLQQVQKTYLCPRRILAHNGHPRVCEHMCPNSLDNSEKEYDETQVVIAVVTRKQHIFNPAICLGVEAKVE
ncbi:hypothetical protein O1611_g180 [Lasiodiplodia mahajangana]|uniref:Uncharacterized protein n=1 Tax=Lasiodiplodia mahajangana TaxID=1108764 RepID=A0ACC2K1K8_9PEZI|nr:hypothetical protein O1611_g180 [Lasiodiplodia mahajangana]